MSKIKEQRVLHLNLEVGNFQSVHERLTVGAQRQALIHGLHATRARAQLQEFIRWQRDARNLHLELTAAEPVDV